MQLISHVLATNFIILLLSGRFDFHIKLPAPAASERKAMLKHIIQRRHLQCNDDILLDVAAKCDGYDGYDLVFYFFLKNCSGSFDSLGFTDFKITKLSV